MFFEGSEKKFELIVKPGGPSFFDWSTKEWAKVVEMSQAQILSELSNERVRAYLLSESSLFVWKHHITMITCGQTRLINALEYVLSKLDPDSVEAVIYERKNEYFPHRQSTDFYQDSKRLKALVGGQAFRFGHADTHHLFLFDMGKSYHPEPSDTTLEVLMYGLRDHAYELFANAATGREAIRRNTGIADLLPGFLIDDYVFSPCGYSLNAINGDQYFTIHVTPQEDSPYVSFETNVTKGDSYAPLVRRVVEVFQPQAFDVVEFIPKNNKPMTEPMTIRGYHNKSFVQQNLSSGYNVSFCHFDQPGFVSTKAVSLEI
ncbi:MAG: adenosylmethionine decarboxylase [Pseudobdellovibrionaceae bacterium]|nr:MAG: adenosylmethionine decarboxylase [Pseudobdellovibrionaceae bacterium]